MRGGAAIQHTPDEARNPTSALVDRLFRLAEEIPADARRMSAASLLDWIAVTLYGAADPIIDALVSDVVEEGEGRSTLVGRSERVRAIDAALINGVASHVIDYDDGLKPMGGHPSAPIVPALLALAEQRHASGRDFVTAHVLAVEAASCIGLFVTPEHYARGFHTTATIGAMGAAAGCAWLLGLDHQGMTAALGMAGARAAGLKASFGTPMKPIQVGWAAAVGLSGARWAARGLTGAVDILGDGQGFARTHSRNADVEAMLASVPPGAHIRDTRFKRYASCGGTHASLDAYFKLAASTPFDPEEVEKVVVEAWPGLDQVCNIAKPVNGLEAKFSLRGTIAMALLGIDLGDPGHFDAATVNSPEFVAMCERIETSPVHELDYGQARFAIRLKDGRELRGAHADSWDREPVDALVAMVRDKFTSIAKARTGVSRGEQLLEAVGRLGEIEDMAELLALLRS